MVDELTLSLMYTLIVIIIYIIIVYYLWKKKILERLNISFFGPFLMWRTKRGRIFLDKVSKKRRFWNAYGILSIIILLLSMVLISAIILLGSIAAMNARAEPLPPEQILALPGLNPLIPLWYGIFALAIAVIIHEFAHGILARSANIKLKSLGILYCIVPVGAFVEPDEKQLESTKKSNRVKIFSTGPATNIIFGLLCAMIFSWCFMASLTPVEDGVIIFETYEGPAQFSQPEIKPGMEIIEINGEPIDGYSDYFHYNGSAPNETISLGILYKGEHRRIENITSGLTVISTGEDDGEEYPAYKAGIKPGMIIAEVDGVEIRNHGDFSDFMDTTAADQVISITVLEYQKFDDNNPTGNLKGFYVPRVFNVTLTDKYDALKDIVLYDIEKEKGKGYLGVSTSYLGLGVRDVNDFSESLAYPVRSAESTAERRANIIRYAVALPMDLDLQILPFHSPLTDLYEVEGPLGVLPNDLFWIFANAFYYLFWINLLVGTFNALPMKPLDGGYVFKDGIDSVIKRIKKGLSEAKRERYVNLLSNFIAFFFFLLILWTLIVPRIL